MARTAGAPCIPARRGEQVSAACHNIKDGAERVHVPGCMGCAAMGHDWCTCFTPSAQDQRWERFARLEERVERLERANPSDEASKEKE